MIKIFVHLSLFLRPRINREESLFWSLCLAKLVIGIVEQSESMDKILMKVNPWPGNLWDFIYLFSAPLVLSKSLLGLNRTPSCPSHLLTHIGRVGVFK